MCVSAYTYIFIDPFRKPQVLQRLSHPWVSAQFSIFHVLLECSAGKDSHELAAVPQPVPWSICLLSDAQVGDTRPWAYSAGSMTPTEVLLFLDG